MKIEYHNLYIHYVFCTYLRLPLIAEENRERIEKYISGIVKNYDSHLYAIYANPEHLHFLVSRSSGFSDELLANIVASASEIFINKNKLCMGNFKWQESCSAFSVSKADVDKVCHYIMNQPIHHQKISFTEEFAGLLKFYQQTIHPKIR